MFYLSSTRADEDSFDGGRLELALSKAERTRVTEGGIPFLAEADIVTAGRCCENDTVLHLYVIHRVETRRAVSLLFRALCVAGTGLAPRSSIRGHQC